ncbi:hypothetical protein EX30DRAFT_189086 [Ascodesmis nigricans]|uniref:Uncharacterized protein n=1 Tax=Ascodesmis nigricans TaxID=341454 RepID=A0A4S2N0J3_9PEZI|nr:hypothetical protein EX30DRAFT_189086 [Ascodesmis nigricans]
MEGKRRRDDQCMSFGGCCALPRYVKKNNKKKKTLTPPRNSDNDQINHFSFCSTFQLCLPPDHMAARHSRAHTSPWPQRVPNLPPPPPSCLRPPNPIQQTPMPTISSNDPIWAVDDSSSSAGSEDDDDDDGFTYCLAGEIGDLEIGEEWVDTDDSDDDDDDGSSSSSSNYSNSNSNSSSSDSDIASLSRCKDINLFYEDVAERERDLIQCCKCKTRWMPPQLHLEGNGSKCFHEYCTMCRDAEDTCCECFGPRLPAKCTACRHKKCEACEFVPQRLMFKCWACDWASDVTDIERNMWNCPECDYKFDGSWVEEWLDEEVWDDEDEKDMSEFAAMMVEALAATGHGAGAMFQEYLAGLGYAGGGLEYGEYWF